MKTRTLRPVAWFALLTLLLQIAGGVAFAARVGKAAAADAALHEFCTQAGLQVRLDGPAAPATPSPVTKSHCPFCASQPVLVAPLQAAGSGLPITFGAERPQALPAAPPTHPVLARLPAPRAPPASVPA